MEKRGYYIGTGARKCGTLKNKGGEKVEEKEKKEPVEEGGEAAENGGGKNVKEQLAEYMMSRMPKEILDSLEKGKSVEEVIAQMENSRLKKENDELKKQLEKTGYEPLKLTGEGGEREKDPFALGFMQAMNDY